MSKQPSNSRCDVLIVGMGMVGALAAMALSPYNDSIIILDKNLPDIDRPFNQQSRPLSLNYNSVQALQSLGLWEAFEPYATPIQTVHVSQNGYLGTTQFHADQLDVDALGYVVPADVLAVTLIKSALALQNVTFQQSNHIEAIEQANQSVETIIETDDGLTTIVSECLLGCDGTHSDVAKWIGAELKEQDATIEALICDLDHAPLKHIAYERFTDQGTLALLPKTKTQAGLVFTGESAAVQQLLSLDDVAFAAQIQQWMGDRLLPGFTATKRLTRPLQSVYHTPIAKQQVVLLGNAARTLYPIAAQGFNLGLRDVMQLQAIFKFAHTLENQSDYDLIQTFTLLREEDQQATSDMTSKIGKTFKKKHPLFSHMRGCGLMGMDLIAPLKNKMARRALGLSGAQQTILKLVSYAE